MSFMANSRLADGVTREQFVAFTAEHPPEKSSWDLIRHHVVTQYMYKTGDEPGVLLILDVPTLEEATDLVNSLPIVQRGLLTFEVDPVSRLAKF